MAGLFRGAVFREVAPQQKVRSRHREELFPLWEVETHPIQTRDMPCRVIYYGLRLYISHQHSSALKEAIKTQLLLDLTSVDREEGGQR